MHVKSSVVVAQYYNNASWLFDGGFLMQDLNTIRINVAFLFYRL